MWSCSGRRESATKDGTLRDSVVEAMLTCVAARAGQHMGTVTKKLPLSMTLANLKRLAQRLFKLKVDNIALFLKAESSPMPEALPDLDSLQLSDFDLQVRIYPSAPHAATCAKPGGT